MLVVRAVQTPPPLIRRFAPPFPRSGRRQKVGRYNFEIQRISYIVLILFMQRGIFLFELFLLVIEFLLIILIKYSYLTNIIIALSLIRWTNKRILSYSVESDGFSKKNGGVSRRGRIDCSPQANYAFSRILGEGGPRGAVNEGWRSLY